MSDWIFLHLFSAVWKTDSLLRVTFESPRLHSLKPSRRDSVYPTVLRKVLGLSFVKLTWAKCPSLNHDCDHKGQNKPRMVVSHPNHVDESRFYLGKSGYCFQKKEGQMLGEQKRMAFLPLYFLNPFFLQLATVERAFIGPTFSFWLKYLIVM